MMLIRLVLLLTIILHGVETCDAQHTVQKGKERSDGRRSVISGEMEHLLDLVRSTPPEVASDALLKVAESDRIQDAKVRTALIDEAFERAKQAQNAARMRGLPSVPVDTSTGYQSRAFSLELDTVSLQVRATRAMLIQDQRKAVEMFNQISFSVNPLACDSPFFYDTSKYYEVASELAAHGFSPKERAKGEHIFLVERLAAAIKSPSQVEPFSKLLVALITSWKLEDVSRIALLFANAMPLIPDDPRSFGATTHRYSVMAMGALLTELSARHAGAFRPLFQSYERYLARNLMNDYCSDSPNGNNTAKPLPEYLTYFTNEVTPKLFPQGDAPLLAVDSIRPKSIQAGAVFTTYWQTMSGAQALKDLKYLRFGTGSTPLSVADRASSEWQVRFRESLERTRSWKPDEEKQEMDYYAQKCKALLSLTELSPDTLSTDLFNEFLSTAQFSQVRSRNVVQWLVMIRDLIGEVRRTRPERLRWLTRQLQSTGDPILALYAKLSEQGLYQ